MFAATSHQRASHCTQENIKSERRSAPRIRRIALVISENDSPLNAEQLVSCDTLLLVRKVHGCLLSEITAAGCSHLLCARRSQQRGSWRRSAGSGRGGGAEVPATNPLECNDRFWPRVPWA